ncbi:extensin family protein [Devosia sp.]|uniref:extensin-like domain-containing protein n=1 Tax=Devosia sp. TaxID=1871048 RepID=UPI0032630836
MRHLIPATVAVFIALAAPVAARDFLQQMVEVFTPPTQHAPTPHKPVPVAPRPEPRPAELDAAPAAPDMVLPRPRPEHLGEPEAVPEVAKPAEPVVAAPVAPTLPDKPVVPGAEPQPEPVAPQAAPPEPDRIYQTACPALTTGAVEGKILPPIHDGQCQAQSPLSLTAVSVNGRMVPISGAVTTDCAMATMLPAWMADVDGYVWAKDNTRIKSINVGTSYMCRNRVGGSSTETLSEHGFADALDVTGFALEDGRNINVETGWPGTEEQGSAIVRYAHDAACSKFMTTLGPEANAEHHDHIHVDFGCHGKSCTARLCE